MSEYKFTGKRIEKKITHKHIPKEVNVEVTVFIAGRDFQEKRSAFIQLRLVNHKILNCSSE